MTMMGRFSSLHVLIVVSQQLLNDPTIHAWTPTVRDRFRRAATSRLGSSNEAKNEWGTADNWEELSKANAPSITSDMLETDYLKIQAMMMENFGMGEEYVETKDDAWIRQTIETMAATEAMEDTDTPVLSVEETTRLRQQEQESTEITRMVRCNESPENLLLSTGRAIPALTDAERNDIRQLLDPEPTVFLIQSVRTMFLQHARSKVNGEVVRVMEGPQIAQWMEVCLDEETVSAFDGRVRLILGQYGTMGGVREEGLQKLYADAAHNNPSAVWRDLRAHGIVSPAELEHSIRAQELQATLPDPMLSSSTMPLDECELVDDEAEVEESWTDRHGKSSYEKVEVVPNTKVPLWIKDGEFVFIDEQSCIGCTQCALVSPGSFQMLPHSGRARAFLQRGKTADIKSAVETCPVDCMHYVSFDELKTFESTRDEPVADHHRHFGHTKSRGYVAATPLHVSRRDTDASHKDSFYHTLAGTETDTIYSAESSQCPTKGCYDCPRYAEDPDSNPYFQEKLRQGYHIRSSFLQNAGIANEYRKKADL